MTPEENMKILVTGMIERQAHVDRFKVCIDDKVVEVAMKYVTASIIAYPNYSYPSSKDDFIDWHIEGVNIEIDWTSTWAYGGHGEGTLTFAAAYLYDEDMMTDFQESCASIAKERKLLDDVQERLNDERELERLKKKLT